MTHNSRIISDHIERAVNAEVARRMGTISNPVLRATIEELLRDTAYEKILAALRANPPQSLDIAKAVKESMDEISLSVRGLKSSLNGKFKLAGRNDNGGKDDSGSKTSPRRSYGGKDDSGGKDDRSDYGGKDDRPGYGGK